MEVQAQYLRLVKQDYEELIGELPESFNIDDKVTTPIKVIRKGRLTSLIGSTLVSRLFTITEADVPTEREREYIDIIKYFLVFATWAEYLRSGNVTYTKSGPVLMGTEGRALTPEQKETLARPFDSKADAFAKQLSKMYESDKHTVSCKSGVTGVHIGKTTATVIKAPNRKLL